MYRIKQRINSMRKKYQRRNPLKKMRLIKDPVQASDRPAVEHEPFGWIDEAEAYGESYHDTEEDLPSSEEGKEQA